MMNKYELALPREEMERVDTLRYSWEKLLSLAVSNALDISLCAEWTQLMKHLQYFKRKH